MKRLIICCDGTWQSALFQPKDVQLTNIARLSTALETFDSRTSPPVPQLKLYLEGIGTGEGLTTGLVHGALGTGILEKVREAYYWLAQNYDNGDEIYLFGFSRGAYIIRLLGTLLHLIGVLDRKTNLSLFPSLFDGFCADWNPHDGPTGVRGAAQLEPLLEAIKQHKQEQLSRYKGGFLVKVVGLFDCVPLYHFRTLADAEKEPERVHLSPFHVPDAPLESHIETALHALAINEERDAYEPLLWRVGRDGLREGQRLEQVWFAGVHSDIGGGYAIHDLSDLTLTWLVSHLLPHLALDIDYLGSLLAHPSASWGNQHPTNKFRVLHSHPRSPPTSPPGRSSATYERLHRSLLEQDDAALPPAIVDAALAEQLGPSPSGLFAPLEPYERQVRDAWRIKAVPAAVEAAQDVQDLDDDGVPVPVPQSPPPSPALSAVSTESTPPHLPLLDAQVASPFVPVARVVSTGGAEPGAELVKSRRKAIEEEVVEAVRQMQEKVDAAGNGLGRRRAR
ncbi:hypothetical protein JCM10207_002530 [Rhodosporidiobolus poonsookiae]